LPGTVPGDPMPSSRFVKAATLRKGFGLLPTNGKGWMPTAKEGGVIGPVQTIVDVAMQLVQMTQATPYGTALMSPKHKDPLDPRSQTPEVGDWTMWSVVRDHTNRVFYFTTRFNCIIRALAVNALNFTSRVDGHNVPSFPTIPHLPAPSTWHET
jgi:choloylglycine hydrolase